MSSLTSRLSAEASRIAEQADELRQNAGENLHDAASSIREGGQRGSKVIADLAENTAAKLDGAGSLQPLFPSNPSSLPAPRPALTTAAHYFGVT